MTNISRQYDAFICYHRKSGAALAQLFRANLEARGLKVFLDVKETYWGPFPRELRDHVVNTPCLIVLLTQGALASPWMVLEIEAALRSGTHIVVVRESEYELPPEQEIPVSVREIAYLNHLIYVHDFNDEVVRRVVQLVQSATHAKKRWHWLLYAFGAATLCTLAVGLSLSRHEPAAPEVSQHALTASPAKAENGPTLVGTTAPKPVVTEAPDASMPAPPVHSEPLHAAPARALPGRASALHPLDAPHGLTARPGRDARDCDPNYYYDESGEKRFKKECFLLNEGSQHVLQP